LAAQSALCGSETWIEKKKNETRIQTAEMEFLSWYKRRDHQRRIRKKL